MVLDAPPTLIDSFPRLLKANVSFPGPNQIFRLVLAGLVLSAGTQTTALANSVVAEPKTSIEWFQRARDRMNIRTPGSTPFHMKVTFQAFPGLELLAEKQKSEFVTGDGTYEETWLAPHKWRREVTLADYHAVEVESERGRKMQVSSEYEPSRVLMLLDALLNPIPRNLASREFKHGGASGWTVDHLSKGNASLVRISKTFEFRGTEFSDIFYFLPTGLLFLRNDRGLETRWEDIAEFSGKVLPKHLSVKTGEHDLLDAKIAVESVGRMDESTFDLPGNSADPGMTLRSIQFFERRFSHPDLPSGPFLALRCDRCAFQIVGVLDRSGRYRELELISRLNVPNERILRDAMNELRKIRWPIPEIDHSPCEFLYWRGFDVREFYSISRQ